MKTVCHITTVHKAFDTRIYHKECVSLASKGFDVKLIVVNQPDAVSTIDNLEVINVDVPYGSKYQRILKVPKMARLAAQRLKADVYHFHDPEFLFSALKMKRNGHRVIYDAHEDVPKQIMTKDWIHPMLRSVISRLTLIVENQIVSKLDATITVVEGIVERMESKGARCVLVKNYPDLQKLPNPSPYAEKKNQICYVGDLTFIRGIKESIDAMETVDSKLVLAGGWSDKTLRAVSEKSKGFDKVTDLGFVDKSTVQKIFSDSRIGLVLFHPAPNHMDALPNKLFEYLAAGIPVIASNFGWLKKIVSEYDCGIAVDPQNPMEISEAMKSLLSDEQKAKVMGENGRKAVENTFNWRTEEEKLITLYNSILES